RGVTPLYRMARAASCAVLSGALASPSLANAQNAETSGNCGPEWVDAEHAELESWPDLQSRVLRAFADREDAEGCARVRMTPHDPFISVEVLLDDGRSTVRLVPEARDVVPTLQALLLLPRPEDTALVRRPPAPVVSHPPRQEAKPPKPAPALLLRKDSPPDEAHARRDEPLGFEVSALAGAHLGDRQIRYSLGALGCVRLWNWLVAAGGRAANYAPSPGAAGAIPYSTLEFVLLGGRRFRFDALALDVLAGPGLTWHANHTVVEGPNTRSEVASSGLFPSLLGASHVNFAPGALFGPFVGIEGQLGPSERSDGPASERVARLPGWMLGA